MTEDFVDLFELQAQVREGLEDLFPDRVWVRAEVASMQVRGNGHCYLELSQSGDNGIVAKVKAIIWRSSFMPLAHYFREATGDDIKPGITVLVRSQINYSELYGLSLIIDEIEPQYTLGEAELRKQRTIERLKQEGLLDAQKELGTSAIPYRLAVISASDAAGYGDFKNHLADNEYGFVFDVNLFPATMQGEGAPRSIRAALESIDDSFDAVLIMRGGGSVLDLACFDEYELCAAIARCGVPVYTAIGHDRDFHVADMVAYDFVKTPTALADAFIDAFAAEDERISSYSTRLKLAFLSKVGALESKLALLESRISGADPRNILSRGYTLVTDADGVVLKKSEGLAPGDRLRLYFADGSLEVSVTGKCENKLK